jgi:hypothetical protein
VRSPITLPASVAHQLVDHPDGYAGVLEPRRERMPKVMRASQPQLSQQVVLPGRIAGGPPARLVLSGQPDGVQPVEGTQDGRRPWGAPSQALTDLLDRLRSAVA